MWRRSAPRTSKQSSTPARPNSRYSEISSSGTYNSGLVTKLVFENLKHRPIRTLLTVLAIGLQVTLVLTIVGLSRGLLEASQNRTRGVGADILVRPPGAAVMGMSGAPMSEKVADFVEKQPNVALAQGVVMHPIG